jgi:hypothetical protein
MLNLAQPMAFERLPMAFERLPMAFERLTMSGEMPLCLPPASTYVALPPASALRP